METLHFSYPLHGTDEILEDSPRIDEISEILKLLLIFKLSFSKPFWNNSNYASIASIRKVMKFL